LPFDSAAVSLSAELIKQFTALKSDTPSLSDLNVSTEFGVAIVSGRFPVLIIDKRARFINSLDGCEISVRFYNDFPNMVVPGYLGSDDAVLLEDLQFSFGLVRPSTAAFARQDESYSAEQLTDYIVRKYLDIAENQRPKRSFARQ
jgi:hypothetical protein